MSQRNVCYIVFSSRHRALVASVFEVFSKRLQTVLFTLRDLVLNAVYNATADV